MLNVTLQANIIPAETLGATETMHQQAYGIDLVFQDYCKINSC